MSEGADAFRSPPPEVRLVAAFERPFDGAVAAARTCYSSKGIVWPEEVGGDSLPEGRRDEAIRRRNELARDIYRAGHHTVFQHAHFEFAIDRISRHALWSFFHAHPFYNSEQVSQRYVKVEPGAAAVPRLSEPAAGIYERVLARLQEAYRDLSVRLEPVAERIFFEIFPARRGTARRWRREIRRRAQEAARYVLPVATWARLYHTVSAVTLLRYHRLARLPDLPTEVQYVVRRMVEEVLRWDPSYAEVLEQPLPDEALPENRTLEGLGGAVDPGRADRFAREFDAELGGRVSRLVGFAPDAEATVAQAVREVLGVPRADLDDDAALRLAADPARNPMYGESLNLTSIAKITRALHHAQYTFRRKLSHTADSQDQRHRMTPASRPVLVAHLRDEPDVVLPALALEEEPIRRRFDEAMALAWEGIGRLRREGAPREALVYLLPNAVAVRATESADFLALRHKHAMRLCYNAQEEIWRASLDEALQVSRVHPRLGAFLLPPCTIRRRAGKKPFCPEGRRYCGVPVWGLEPRDYVRRL
ncbi:MAG: FAD-dependent thymidylate synthase [Acidobacteria bacterium]|nr:MAG: FAD-dependent thymidylate synthase [Acidobacteriota bacterium]